jgi:predicted nucleic acid-binding protein
VLRDLVIAIAAIEGGRLPSLPECRQAFADCWRVEVDIEEIKPIVQELVDSGIAHREGTEVHLSKAHLRALQASAREWDQTEQRALREWELMVLGIAPGLEPDELAALRDDLMSWLHLIIARHGLDAAMILYPEDERARRFLSELDGHGFEDLPERGEPLASLRERVLREFVRVPTPDQRRFLARLLNICFYMTVLTIDPTAGKLAQAQLRGYRLYLDTNFLYAVLGGAPHDEVDAARRLIRLSREAGIELAVTPWTMEELRTSIARSRRDIESRRAMIRPDLAQTMIAASGEKGFKRLYWQAYARNRTEPADVFDRLEHFEHELKRHGIHECAEHAQEIEAEEQRIREYSSLLNSERFPFEKDWVVLEHDAKARLLIERLRGGNRRLLSSARYWFVTFDGALPHFARRVPDNGDTPPALPFCISPSAWAQIVRALTPRTQDYERTIVDLLTSPFIGYRPALNQAVLTQVVARMDHLQDASPEMALAIVTDTAKVRELERAAGSEREEALPGAVDAAYSTRAREQQDEVAESLRRVEQAQQALDGAEVRARKHEQELARHREQAQATVRELAQAREREAAERGEALERAEEQREAAEQQLRSERERTSARLARNRRLTIGFSLIALGIAIALVLPLALVSGGYGQAGSVLGGVAVGLIGTRVAVGRDWSGEVAMWAGVLLGLAAVLLAIVQSRS